MKMKWIAQSCLALALLGCGDSKRAEPNPEGAVDEALPCEERSYETCEDDRCYAVRATEHRVFGSVLCSSDTEKKSCRARGPDCADDDAMALSCDDTGRYWVTPQTCIPADNHPCEAPEGITPFGPSCAELETPSEACRNLAPPEVVLRAPDETLTGVQGSSCTKHESGCGLCADRQATVETFIAVNHGDKLLFDSGAARLISGALCTPACPPTLLFESVGCDGQVVQNRLLGEDQTWLVDLDPGVYKVWLSSAYEDDDRYSGDLYVGFGLTVEGGQCSTSSP